jgi:hypothetical protein
VSLYGKLTLSDRSSGFLVRLSNLPADTALAALVRTAKLRWRIEHDRLLHPPAHHPVPKRDGVRLRLYQVVRELQLLLALWTGAGPTGSSID